MASELSLELIQNLLCRNDELGRKAVGRALVVLNERQTEDEQKDKSTKYHNKKGFQKCHALRGTSMAEYVIRNGKLTDSQWKWWVEPAPGGRRPRITIYATQLLLIAKEKQAKA